MTSRTYQVASGQLLRQAREELAAGDVRQASEKGWGAVDRLRRETGDPDVRRLFDVASVLHINFYED